MAICYICGFEPLGSDESDKFIIYAENIKICSCGEHYTTVNYFDFDDALRFGILFCFGCGSVIQSENIPADLPELDQLKKHLIRKRYAFLGRLN